MAEAKHQIMRWEDPPPRAKPGRVYARGASSYDDVASTLRANPERWALVREVPTPSTSGLGSAINCGRWACFQPAGTFEAVSRRVGGVERIYARYVGGETRG